MSNLTKDILTKEADSLIADLITEYDRLGLRASGNYATALRKEATNNRMQIFGAPYADQMQNGRRPTQVTTGDGVLREKILQWIRVKPITPTDPNMTNEQLAFLITRKIHKDGINVPNNHNAGGVVSNVITGERIKEIVRKIQLAQVESITSEIRNLFEKAAV